MGFLNAMTVDVEDYFHVQAFAGVIARTDWERYPSRVERNTLRLLEMFACRQVRGTFFVLGWVAEKFPGLVQAIRKAGHRVGCHGYAHRLIYEGSEIDFRKDVRRARQTIEDVTGMSVTSFRAPSYSITSETLWAFEVLGEEGFQYDSSIFPVTHDNYGIPDAPRFPYTKRLKCGRQITEFPPSTLRILGSNIPVAGGGYLRFFPYRLTAWAIHYLNKTERQPAMVYLHPWEIDPDQPRISASWLSRFRHYNNLDSTETKCQKLLDDFSWAPMEEVLSQRLLQ
ncbi:MAG TPA: XrtA system polysaccharide deacetylase [Candidatus Binatia bacterium]|nr:XrtA system polysaccharide deacetylase [Candidatus Binatia bacterium]